MALTKTAKWLTRPVGLELKLRHDYRIVLPWNQRQKYIGVAEGVEDNQRRRHTQPPLRILIQNWQPYPYS